MAITRIKKTGIEVKKTDAAKSGTVKKNTPAVKEKQTKVVKPELKTKKTSAVKTKLTAADGSDSKKTIKTEVKTKTLSETKILAKTKTLISAGSDKKNEKKSAEVKIKSKPARAAKKTTPVKSSAGVVKNRDVKKETVKIPPPKPESMNVISSDMENLYGKHYIINTAQELPESYGKNRLITLVRDPEWLYTFWDLAPDSINDIKKAMGPREFNESKKVLRIYDNAGVKTDDYSEIELTDTASSWYIHVNAEKNYFLELGYLSKKGEFYKLAASESVAAPASGVSELDDEKWMIKDGVFEKIYELSGGSTLGMSSADLMQAMARGMKQEDFFQLVSRGASDTLSSQFSAEKTRQEEEKRKQRKFWMVLNTEIIVYGATEPDANVTLMGKPIKLRPDGTFSIRMALPDGSVDIPAVGVSADRIDEITITPAVHKSTYYSKKEKENSL